MYMHNMNYNSRSAYLHVEEDEEEKQEEDDGYDYLAWRWFGGDCVERANVRLVAMMAAKA